MIIKLIRVLILSFLFVISINTQSFFKNNTDSHSIYLNNFEFSKFDKYLDKSELNQLNREYYLLKKNFVLHLLNSGLGENKLFLNKLNQFSKKIDQDKVNTTLLKNYFLASSKTMEMITYIVENEAEKAFSIARSNYKELKNIAKKGIDDAYYDLAIHILFFNKIRDKKSFIVTLLGLEYDLELAKNYLEKAINKGKYNNTESIFLLTEIFKMQNSNLKLAEKYLQDLIKIYSKNTLFIYNYATILVKMGDYKKAKKILDENYLLIEKYPNINPFYHFLLGDIYLIFEDYEKSINCFKKFSINLKDNSYIGEANYKSAISKLLKGEINESRRFLSKTTLGNVDLESDVFFRFRASEIIENITNRTMIELFYIEILLFNKNFLEAEKRLQKISFSYNEQKNLQLIFKAKIKIYHNQIFEGYNDLIKLVNSKSKDNNWLKAEAALILSEIKINNNKKKEALFFVELAENNNNSYFKENFKKRIDYLKIMLRN